jgi:IS30 family transposase
LGLVVKLWPEWQIGMVRCRAEGLSLRAIARQLGRAASTVSRELRRNLLPKGGYLPAHAEGCYLERRQRPAILERDAKLARFVRERLLEGWTLEQIAGWLKRGEERGLRTVSTETIYAFVHRAGQKGEKLWKLLPRGRAKRGRRRAREPRSTIAERRSIHNRPEAVQERKEAGHWEGDLLICKRTRPVLVLKERKTRFVLAARLAGKSAAETVAVMMAVFRRLDPRLRSSVTFDNDTAGPLPHLCPARPSRQRLRHDNLVLRCLRLLAERSGGERQRPVTARPAARPRPRRAR